MDASLPVQGAVTEDVDGSGGGGDSGGGGGGGGTVPCRQGLEAATNGLHGGAEGAVVRVSK